MDDRKSQVARLAANISAKAYAGTLMPDDDEYLELLRLAQELALDQRRA